MQACQKRYKQLEDLAAAKRRQAASQAEKNPKSHDTKRSIKSRNQNHGRTSPSGSPPEQQSKFQSTSAGSSPSSAQPSPAPQQLRPKQPATIVNNGNQRPLFPGNMPPALAIPPATTIFPLSGPSFTFDPSILMKQSQMPSIFTIGTALPAILPNTGLQPSLATGNLNPLATVPSLNATPQVSPALHAIPLSPITTASPLQVSMAGGNPTTAPLNAIKNPAVTMSSVGVSNIRPAPMSHNPTPIKQSPKRPISSLSSPVPLAPSPIGSGLVPNTSNYNEDFKKKKRRRRTASEISRNYKCDIASCSKAYGSEGALKMHIRLVSPLLPQLGILEILFSHTS